MAKEISGIAIFPRLSENDVFYWPQELQKFHNRTVPLRWNHIQTDEAIIGEATFTYDDENRQVMYRATVTDPVAQKEIDKGFYKVSIGASVAEDDFICHKDGNCVDAPILNVPEELSIVANPGIPESSLDILEHIRKITEGKNISCLECVAPIHITSHKHNKTENKLMPKDDIKKEDCGCQGKTEVTCPDGQMDDGNGNCVPKTDAPATSEIECPPGKKPNADGSACVDDAPTEDANTKTHGNTTVNVNVPESKGSDIDKKVEAKMDKFLEEFKKEWKPKSEVSTVTEDKPFKTWLQEEKEIDAKAVIKKVLEDGHARIVLNKEDWIKEYTKSGAQRVSEAVATSGTIPGIHQTSDIVIVPGANSFKPIRQYGQFQAIETGKNTARFYTIDVTAFGAITESTSTDITASTHNFTAIDVTCSPRGWLQQVLKQNLEDWPEAFLDKLKESARLSSIKDEHRLIVQTMASTNNDFGGTTTAPYHISGTDGVAVTTTTLEDAAGEFLREGIEHGRSHLEAQGHDPVNEKFVALISARAFRTLEADPDLARYVQQGDPSISKLGRMSEFLGVELIVSNELLVANNAYRNIMLVSGKSFALASQREMEIELTKEIRGQFVDIVATHRIGVDEIDKTSYVIISSIQS